MFSYKFWNLFHNMHFPRLTFFLYMFNIFLIFCKYGNHALYICPYSVSFSSLLLGLSWQSYPKRVLIKIFLEITLSGSTVIG